jgi:hypothetical protein
MVALRRVSGNLRKIIHVKRLSQKSREDVTLMYSVLTRSQSGQRLLESWLGFDLVFHVYVYSITKNTRYIDSKKSNVRIGILFSKLNSVQVL